MDWLKGERGGIESSFAIVICIGLAAVLMFVFPLMTMADKQDDKTVQDVQIATTELVDTITTTKSITQEDYDNFLLTLAATGNSYDVEITVYIPEENPAKKQTSATQTTGDTYYIMYTSQVLEQIPLNLDQGAMVLVEVENTNTTIAEQLRNAIYSLLGNDSATIVASDSGTVQ